MGCAPPLAQLIGNSSKVHLMLYDLLSPPRERARAEGLCAANHCYTGLSAPAPTSPYCAAAPARSLGAIPPARARPACSWHPSGLRFVPAGPSTPCGRSLILVALRRLSRVPGRIRLRVSLHGRPLLGRHTLAVEVEAVRRTALPALVRQHVAVHGDVFRMRRAPPRALRSCPRSPPAGASQRGYRLGPPSRQAPASAVPRWRCRCPCPA